MALMRGGRDFKTRKASGGARLTAPLREAGRWLRRLRRIAGVGSGKANARTSKAISLIAASDLDSFGYVDADGVLVIMPCVDIDKGMAAAELLLERAGMNCKILVVHDVLRQGFVKTLNAAAARASVKYVVYLAEDAFPGLDWLHEAYNTLERSGKGLLGFNDGKWKGRIASFGMVRINWVTGVYGGAIFYPGYIAHKADNELTVIARAQDQYEYNPNCTLVEYDPKKIFKDPVRSDPRLFQKRFQQGFDGLVPPEMLAQLADEYFVPWPDEVGGRASHGPDALTSFRPDILEADTRSYKEGQNAIVATVVQRLMSDAEEALSRSTYSVTDKTSLPPSGNPNDYWHPAPYWWPNPNTADGLPYISRDGVRAPGTRLYEPESEKYDRTRLQRVFDDSVVLALAWKFSGDPRYADRGVQILKRFFLDPESRMMPHLKYAQVRMGHDGNLGSSSGIIETKDFYFYLDAVRLLTVSGALSTQTLSAFSDWLATYLKWLLESPQGRDERKAVNNHGSYYDLQVASIAAFLDERSILFESLSRARARIERHFAPDGSQPAELRRKISAHYCCFNFQGWIGLAEIAARWDVDLWSYRAPNGASLTKGAEWLLSHIGKDWPFEQIDDFDAERYYPIWYSVPAGVLKRPAAVEIPLSKYHVKPVFFPHDGIRPYWNLGN